MSSLIICHLVQQANTVHMCAVVCCSGQRWECLSAQVWLKWMSGFSPWFSSSFVRTVSNILLWQTTDRHARTQKDKGGWKEEDRKMSDRAKGGIKNGRRTCCPGVHAALQSTHPSCLTPSGRPNLLQQCHLVASYRPSPCLHIIQVCTKQAIHSTQTCSYK